MKRAFTLVEGMIILVIVGLCIAMFIPVCQRIVGGERDARDRYEVWCKLERRTDLTFEQWRAAERAGYLTATRK